MEALESIMKIERGTYVPKEEIKNQEMLDNVVAAFERIGFSKYHNSRANFNNLECDLGVGVARGNILFVNCFAIYPITYNKLMELAGMIEWRPNVGDTVYMGKFKNKKTVIKEIGEDETGMPTINKKKVVTFRTTPPKKNPNFKGYNKWKKKKKKED